MAIFRQYIAPFFVVLIFIIALVAVSSRIFLPSDMAAPAPVEESGEVGSVNTPLFTLSTLSGQSPQRTASPSLSV
ncbi:hypothetical protein [Brasilonema bromeliae]|uniref:Uncharacterized protein n=1 Tax=Brasilonema bromeliae SPC951 TaxID=385972 RepID=A0ABX1PE13_9CYAN|nr:hypothetical protein [Brasilonema bromeliae]NMG22027.1 hypothetical protein [Brasilonema bromeliae SPC951]